MAAPRRLLLPPLAVLASLMARIFCAALLAALPLTLALLPKLAVAASSYELAARIPFKNGAAQGSLWLDSDNYLTLEVGTDSVQVMRTSYSSPARSEFLSNEFMEKYVCEAELAGRLKWKLSPGRRFLFFGWRNEDSGREWTLIDISAAPRLRLKRFDPPAGMQIDDVLFSPDDRYAVFRHDYSHEGSDTSLLVMDLEAGRELWRVPSGELGFIEQMWWASAIYDQPRFHALAMLYDTEFLEQSGIAVCDLKAKSVIFSADSGGVLLGAEALWGKVSCRSSDGSYVLAASIPGHNGEKLVELSSQPVNIHLLPDPGLVLISNNPDGGADQLWLVNLLSGQKSEVDRDCAEFSVASDGKLLVRAQAANEVRIYELVSN